MHLKIIVMLFSLVYLASGKNSVKTLTESNGQEVIEIGTPIKELPIGLEEEPGADDDSDEDDEKTTLKNTAKPQVLATKKESKKTTQASVKKDETKDADKAKELKEDEDEERIEKELAEIYKDTAEYKTDSEEDKDVAKEPSATIEKTTEEAEITAAEDSDKPIGRQRNNFRFQPDSTDQVSVEKFRTSVDEISCNNREKLKGTAARLPVPTTVPGYTDSPIGYDTDNAFRTINNGIILITAVLFYVFICT